MPKNYRERNLNVRCQIAKSDPANPTIPLRDEKGHFVLDFDGLWFLKVSGADSHERKRLIPEDYQAFFKRDVEGIKDALKAEGITDQAILDQVTVAAVYESEYVTRFRREADTFAPPGQPDQFTIVLPKNLVVNLSGSVHSNGKSTPAPVIPSTSSLFAALRSQRVGSQQNGSPRNESQKGEPPQSSSPLGHLVPAKLSGT